MGTVLVDTGAPYFSTKVVRITEAEETLRLKRAALEDPAIASDAPKLIAATAEVEEAQKIVDQIKRGRDAVVAKIEARHAMPYVVEIETVELVIEVERLSNLLLVSAPSDSRVPGRLLRSPIGVGSQDSAAEKGTEQQKRRCIAEA